LYSREGDRPQASDEVQQGDVLLTSEEEGNISGDTEVKESGPEVVGVETTSEVAEEFQQREDTGDDDVEM
jgi:hypothetical protein